MMMLKPTPLQQKLTEHALSIQKNLKQEKELLFEAHGSRHPVPRPWFCLSPR